MSYAKPIYEVADIARQFGAELKDKYMLTAQQKKVLTALCNCRTAVLGGHEDACDQCGVVRFSYNGCRDRHCPKCNGLRREKWVMARKADALPVPYFHIVFTIPDMLEKYCLQHGNEMYSLLFNAAWNTIKTFADKPKCLGAQMGMIAILHTWGQNLARHTHLHCLVPAGGITPQKKWKPCKQQGKFFVHVKKLSKVFRGKFTDGLIELQKQGTIILDEKIVGNFKNMHPLYCKQWVVYAKKPLPTSDSVVEYIGRYSHRVALSNHRIKEVKDGMVTFSWVDYRTNKPGLLPLPACEFLHRFILHVLPPGFMKIRHYGILATRNKTLNIIMVRNIFGVPLLPKPEIPNRAADIFEMIYGINPRLCPHCKNGNMVAIESFSPARLHKSRDGPEFPSNVDFYNQKV
jgi:hypothetical protein